MCVSYSVFGFLETFCKALSILWSPALDLLTWFMSSALPKTERAETEPARDDRGSSSGVGGRDFSIASILIAPTPPGTPCAGSGEDGIREEA